MRDTGEACIMLLLLSWVEEYSTGCSKLLCQGKQLSDDRENTEEGGEPETPKIENHRQSEKEKCSPLQQYSLREYV